MTAFGLGVVILLSLLAISTAAAAPPSLLEEEPGFQSATGLPAHLSEPIGSEEQGLPASSAAPELVSPGGADGLPRTGLDRTEALELAQAAFEPSLVSASFPYDDLEVEKFLSNKVAQIGPGDQPTLPGAAPGPVDDPLIPEADRRTLLESTLPLRSEDSEGVERPVDLSLERSEGSLVPENPLVEVNIPAELGEGIALPESGISIELPGVSQSIAPSKLDESVAFYPNVAEDSDLVVTPVPTGVEVLTQVRSAEAPDSQRFRFSLPPGAKLIGDGSGGAEALLPSGVKLLEVPAPVAVDAAGDQVDSKLEISGDSLWVSISPGPSTVWPVLVDPLVQTYSASISNYGWSFPPATPTYSYPEEGWQTENDSNSLGFRESGGTAGYGIGVESGSTPYYPPGGGVELRSNILSTGDHGGWWFRVPGWLDSQRTTYISRAFLQNLTWGPNTGSTAEPYLFAGLLSGAGWVSQLQQRAGAGYGMAAHTYEFPNPEPNSGAKGLFVGLFAFENVPANVGIAKVAVEGATMELTEPATVGPQSGAATAPAHWMNQTALPLELTMSDSGLGMYAAYVTSSAVSGPWVTKYGCTGLALEPCPKTWATQWEPHQLAYSPASLPNGIDKLEIVGEDALGKRSAPVSVEVEVDHSAPTLALSGSMTEQASLGTKKPSYLLRLNATDGTSEAPQSGVAKTVVKVDGEVVDESAPGCATKNCAISREWTLESSAYVPGKHTIEVTATDEVGLSTTKTLTIELTPDPKLTLTGTLRNEAEVGTTRSSYGLQVQAEGEAQTIQSFSQVTSIGSKGTGQGQFLEPRGIAVNSSGDLWVADTGNDRIEELSATGKYLASIGSKGSATGQFVEPKAIAVDPSGYLWVLDAGNNRIEEFSSTGKYLRSAGSKGTAEGQLSGPTGIAVDSKGDVWVADAGNDRVEEFSPEGKYLAKFAVNSVPLAALALDGKGGFWAGSIGTVLVDWGTEKQAQVVGKLATGFIPTAMDVGPEGDLWAVDPANGSVRQYAKQLVGEFGESGSGAGQLKEPQGLVVDAAGNIWVVDTGNDRVEEWKPKPASESITTTLKIDGATVGSTEAPCTRTACSVSKEWTIDAAHSAAGQHRVTVESTDAVGNVGSRSWTIEINHDTTPPNVSLSGSLTQQSTLGTTRSSYILSWSATDGTVTAPQSGVAKVVVKLDGKIVEEVDPGCATQNCSLARNWTLESGNYANGKHTVEVIATDELGLSTTKTLTIELNSTPAVELSGTMTEQSRVGTDRPRYGLTVNATGGLGGGMAQESSFGSVGTGAGLLKSPTGIAVDGEGNRWVVDSGNNRIEKFSPAGKYLTLLPAKGTTEGLLNNPTGVAVTAAGNLWVVDSGDNRLEEFNLATSKFVRSIGTKGTGEGQFSGPTSVGIDPSGNVWVDDFGNVRLEEFNSEGKYVTQLKEPYPVATFAMDGEGGVWAGYSKARGCLVDSGMKSLSEVKHLICGLEGEPSAIAVSSGHVWVAGASHDRVAEYEAEKATPEKATPILEFGEPGTAERQLENPRGIGLGPQGEVEVVDTGDNRVEIWGMNYWPSSIVTEVKVDGKLVDSTKEPCSKGACSSSTNWTLSTSEYSAGQHAVSVTATETPGNITHRNFGIELAPDTTKPTITVGGELGNAPAGWVGQDTYGLHAVAADGGSGVTSLVFKLDGAVVASEAQGCPEGGCEAEISKGIDMSSYAGGAHKAELVATDASGNSTIKTWTVNVDPEGHITATEAADTLEAMDETSESTAVASNEEILEPEQMESGDNPTFQQEGDEITSVGVPDQTSLTTDFREGFTIKSPEGETTIVPVVGEGSSGASLAGEVAAVSANTGTEVDSVVRPEYNGLQTFEEIRSAESPESFSWRVRLGATQKLVLVNPQQAEVVYEDGTESFLITAEHAKDAVGVEVPTRLEVTGDVLTLVVEHKSHSYVYPIVAANYWETSYVVPVEVEKPEDETEIWQREKEEAEQIQKELEAEWDGAPPPPPPATISRKQAERYVEIGPFQEPENAPPPLPPPGAATASDVREYTIYRSSCGHSCDWWKAKVYNAAYIRHTESVEWEHGTQVHAGVDQALLFRATIFTTTWNCGAVGPMYVHKGSGEHLIAYAHFTIESPWVPPVGEDMFPAETNFAFQVWVYPNGFQEKHILPWDGEPITTNCPTVARP